VTLLHDLVRRSAARTPDATAVVAPDAALTYAELDAAADRIAHALATLGAGPGERVGVWLDKSAAAVTALQGVLRTGAAYVPLDPASPAARIRAIAGDCALHTVITTAARAARLNEGNASTPRCMTVEALEALGKRAAAGPFPTPALQRHDMAYILYTSGSTGTPKGVCISHEGALAFVDWAVAEMCITPADRLANHAPFHFDLSVLDLYGAFAAGASVALLPDALAYAPEQLVSFIVDQHITMWYSVPTALVLMMEHGRLLEHDELPLRLINFAGEPFPIRYLRQLVERWPPPRIRYLNLYGPTETNVCTFHEVRDIEPDRARPVPIGAACSGDTVWAERPDGTRASVGAEGELVVSGPTVLLGYWGREPQAGRPYRTGDRVLHVAPHTYEYLGRLDRMVKVRGHRIELGEIETTLELHPAIREAAVIVAGTGAEARLVAFVALTAARQAPSLLELKRHCAERLPPAMTVHQVVVLDSLQRTRTGKIDRVGLGGLLPQHPATAGRPQ
jgi:amino acid adenylation domain-containing protein